MSTDTPGPSSFASRSRKMLCGGFVGFVGFGWWLGILVWVVGGWVVLGGDAQGHPPPAPPPITPPHPYPKQKKLTAPAALAPRAAPPPSRWGAALGRRPGAAARGGAGPAAARTPLRPGRRPRGAGCRAVVAVLLWDGVGVVGCVGLMEDCWKLMRRGTEAIAHWNHAHTHTYLCIHTRHTYTTHISIIPPPNPHQPNNPNSPNPPGTRPGGTRARCLRSRRPPPPRASGGRRGRAGRRSPIGRGGGLDGFVWVRLWGLGRGLVGGLG